MASAGLRAYNGGPPAGVQIEAGPVESQEGAELGFVFKTLIFNTSAIVMREVMACIV